MPSRTPYPIGIHLIDDAGPIAGCTHARLDIDSSVRNFEQSGHVGITKSSNLIVAELVFHISYFFGSGKFDGPWPILMEDLQHFLLIPRPMGSDLYEVRVVIIDSAKQ